MRSSKWVPGADDGLGSHMRPRHWALFHYQSEIKLQYGKACTAQSNTLDESTVHLPWQRTLIVARRNSEFESLSSAAVIDFSILRSRVNGRFGRPRSLPASIARHPGGISWAHGGQAILTWTRIWPVDLPSPCSCSAPRSKILRLRFTSGAPGLPVVPLLHCPRPRPTM